MYSEILISKPEVYLYQIPPTNVKADKGHRASDWNISNPIWQGKFIIFMNGPICTIQLKGPEGIYGETEIEEFPGEVLKPVVDSRRYFTLSLKKEQRRHALIGLGFNNWEDSCEVTSVLKGYFKGNRSWKRKLEQGLLIEATPVKKKRKRKKKSLKVTDAETIVQNSNNLQTDNHESFYKCHQCPQRFELPKALASHWVQTHKLKEAGICQFCENFPFSYKAQRELHLQKIHKFSCDICPIRFDTLNEWKKHRLLKHWLTDEGKSAEPVNQGSVQWECFKCGEQFMEKKQLSSHYRGLHLKIYEGLETTGSDPSIKSHPDKLDQDSSKTRLADYFKSFISPGEYVRDSKDLGYNYIQGNLFKCHLCIEKFESAAEMTHHWSQAHKIIRSCVCTCELPFPDHDQKWEHVLKSHLLDCPICEFQYGNESVLENHCLRYHLSDIHGKNINALFQEKFHCQLCPEKFGYEELLRRHFKAVHAQVEDDQAGVSSSDLKTTDTPNNSTSEVTIAGYFTMPNTSNIRTIKIKSKIKILSKCDTCGEPATSRSHKTRCRKRHSKQENGEKL